MKQKYLVMIDTSGSISQEEMKIFIKEINKLNPWWKRLYYKIKNFYN